MITFSASGWTQDGAKSEWQGKMLGIRIRVYQYSNWGELWLAIGKVHAGTIEEKLWQFQGKTAEAAVDGLLDAYFAEGVFDV